MALFMGGDANEIITPNFVSPTVLATGGAKPSNAADSINGGLGNDTIDGGGGNDTIDGGGGFDRLYGGGGDDRFLWSAYSSTNDTIDGGNGIDTLAIATTNLAETYSLRGVDGHVIMDYDIAPNTTDLDNVERVTFSGLAGGGGLDRFVIGDLTGTDLKQIDIDLSVFPGGVDGLMQTVQVGGAATGELITASGAGGVATVTTGGVTVNISTIDLADRLAVTGGGGADTFDVTALAGAITVNFDGGDGADSLAIRGGETADQIQLFGGSPTPEGDSVDVGVNGAFSHVNLTNVETIDVSTGGGDDRIDGGNVFATAGLRVDAGKGADTVFGGGAADTIDGGAGNDILDGRFGNDSIQAGAGDDTVVWSPGGGSDVVDGGGGYDTLVFNPSNIGEIISMLDMGDGHVTLTRNVASVIMDLDNVEKISFAGSGGGQDVFWFGELSGTDLVAIDVDLNATGVADDGLVDSVSVTADASTNKMVVTGAGGEATVTGAHETVHVTHAEAIDRLVVSAMDGADTLDVRGFTGGMSLTLWGGNGPDHFLFGPSSGATVEILDFRAHSLAASDGDVIVLNGFPDTTFDLAVANHHIVQSGFDVLVTDVNGGVVTLRNTLITDLGASDFVFG